jgi:hypothetical protein
MFKKRICEQVSVTAWVRGVFESVAIPVAAWMVHLFDRVVCLGMLPLFGAAGHIYWDYNERNTVLWDVWKTEDGDINARLGRIAVILSSPGSIRRCRQRQACRREAFVG